MHHTATFDSGYYVDLRQTDDGALLIALNENGRKHFDDIEAERVMHGIHAALCALLEDHLGNGWEIVPPEDLGALTAAPILSNEIVRDDDQTIVEAKRVWWFPDYAVRDEIVELRDRQAILFEGVGCGPTEKL
jgi:hypothetical protein